MVLVSLMVHLYRDANRFAIANGVDLFTKLKHCIVIHSNIRINCPAVGGIIPYY